MFRKISTYDAVVKPSGRDIFFFGSHWITIILCCLSILIGVSYVVLPLDLFSLLLMLSLAGLAGLVNLNLAFYFFLLTLILEYVYLYATISTTKVMFFPYKYFILVVIVSYFLSRLSGKIEKRETMPLDTVLIIVLFYQCVSIMWAPSTTIGVVIIITLLFNYLTYFAPGALIKDEAVLKNVVRLWILSGVITASGIILSNYYTGEYDIAFTKYSGFHMGFVEAGQRPAGFAYGNTAAGFVITSMMLVLGTIHLKKTIGGIALSMLSVMFMLYSVLVTASRGAFLGLFGSFIFFILFNPRLKGQVIKYFFVTILFTVVVILVAKPDFINRLLVGFGYEGTLYFTGGETFTSTSKTAGVTGMGLRTQWWQNALEQMVEKPIRLLSGLGVGGFFYYNGELEHSVYLSFFFEMGVIGLILLIFIITILASNISRYLRCWQEDSYAATILLPATAGLIAMIGIQGLINFDLVTKYFWFLLGFVMAIISMIEKEVSRVD